MLELAFCGDNCNVCPRYSATRSGDEEQLTQVTALWKKAGWRDEVVSSEEMACYGCAAVQWCRYDDVRKCAQAKGISNCGKCDNYPCEKITKVFKQTEDYAKQCKKNCSKEEYECLHKAFFSKKNRLDNVHAEYLSQTSGCDVDAS